MNFPTVWILINLFVGCYSVCSSIYGGEPCTFVPAPPGKTPPCARPGLTYCEHPDHYPRQLIHFLVQKWRYDHQTLISDESKEEFSSYFYPPPSPVYGPTNYNPPNPNVIPTGGYFPEPIHIPKPQHPFNGYPQQGPTYIPPPQNYSSFGLNGYSDNQNVYQEPNRGGPLFTTYKYPTPTNFPQPNRATFPQRYQPSYHGIGEPQITHYNVNDIWKGNERLKRSLRLRRSQQVTVKYLGSEKYSNGTMIHERTKRQNTLIGEPLCRIRSQYIMPRAALSTKGDWKYVVNMANDRYTQLVKSETCASQTCNGICSLPQGYSSRCEQKYVQKRLVALEGGGDQLYTDIFWFPSCCACTISNS